MPDQDVLTTPRDLAPGYDNPLNYAIAARDRDLLKAVEKAILGKQMLLAYQPVMQARNQTRTAFYEGLARVMDENGRIIPAASFIGAIEDTDLGRELDTLALEHGLRALHDNPGLRLSINMSARSIGYQPWNRTLESWLKRDELIGERLILEITETSAVQLHELVVDFMDRLQMQGVCFAMDDFGAGYTAMRFFKDFCFDVIKIDGQFIKGISHCPDNRAMTSALISIARHFDMLIVAECVETRDDAETLAGLGVDCLQGYYFSAPTIRPDWARQMDLCAAV